MRTTNADTIVDLLARKAELQSQLAVMTDAQASGRDALHVSTALGQVRLMLHVLGHSG